MSEFMSPIAFHRLMDWIIEEKKTNRIFGCERHFVADKSNTYKIFGDNIETVLGPAAGPNTQLAQNIATAYFTGSRFFELKTVQKLDGKDLPISKPCILAEDECYNCEWSTELYVPQAFEEYVKAWFLCKFMAVEYGLGDRNGFVFNMSVGYDLEGIKTEKIDKYIEGMKNAENTPIFKECKEYLAKNLDKFERFSKEDLDSIDGRISSSITLSTLHGCPPDEIERIATYLLTEKKVNTFIKCNPTLLGYDYARKILDEMNYDYIAFTDFHFKDDLQYEDAVPMIERLLNLAGSLNLEFGVKITNTFPVDVKQNELPSEEMYMSGKALFPLSISVAERLSKSFNGKLRISYSGGADYFNVDRILDAGIWPITVATTILKPGGYERMVQMADKLSTKKGKSFDGVDVAKLEKIVKDMVHDKYHVKSIKPLPSRKISHKVPLSQCFIAPCENGCPINQDIPLYLSLTKEGRYEEALDVIVDKNPLPFMTGILCAHNCMTKCTRHFYETPVDIRGTKLIAATNAFDTILSKIKPSIKSDKKVAVVGGGPAGLAASYFLARAGINVDLIEKSDKMGGAVRSVIPDFRIKDEDIDKDVMLVEKMGVNMINNVEISKIDLDKYDYVVLALGASKKGVLKLEKGDSINALDFLYSFKHNYDSLNLGKEVVVIGAGNTAMDVARAAKRAKGVEKVSIVYRRTKKYMPADEEELLMAIEDKVELKELLSPIKHENNILYCKRMELSDFVNGRRSVVETDEIVEIKADTVIASVGESVPTEFYNELGLKTDAKGKVVLKDVNTYESTMDKVYVVGDGMNGAATIVEAIRDGKMAAESIVGRILSNKHDVSGSYDTIHEKKSYLVDTVDGCDGGRCLECKTVCENCVSVCPNRANVAIDVNKEEKEIVHVDYMCNECGNCEVFCPYSSAPYKDKFTLFENEEEMHDSKNDGFAPTGENTYKIRLDNIFYDYKVGEKLGIDKALLDIIDTINSKYSYMLKIK